MFAVVINYFNSLIIMGRTFSKFFSVAATLKSIGELWTKKARTKYSLLTRLGLTGVKLFHLCALVFAVAIVFGLRPFAAPVITAIISATALIKNIADLIATAYYRDNCYRQLEILTQQLENNNLDYNNNIALFDDIDIDVKQIEQLKAKKEWLNTCLNEIEKIQRPADLKACIEKIKEKIIDSNEIKELIKLHLNQAGSNTKNIKKLLSNLQAEIEQTQSTIAQKRQSIAYLSHSWLKGTSSQNDIAQIEMEIMLAESNMKKLRKLEKHFYSMQTKINQLIGLKTHYEHYKGSNGNFARCLQKDIKRLEQSLNVNQDNDSLSLQQKFYASIMEFFANYAEINDNNVGRVTSKLKSLYQNQEKKITYEADHLKHLLFMRTNTRLRNLSTRKQLIQEEFSEIIKISKRILEVKSTLKVIVTEQQRTALNAFFGLFLLGNATLLCLSLHWALTAMFTVTMFALTVISFGADVIHFFKNYHFKLNENEMAHKNLKELIKEKLKEINELKDSSLIDALKSKLFTNMQSANDDVIDLEKDAVVFSAKGKNTSAAKAKQNNIGHKPYSNRLQK